MVTEVGPSLRFFYIGEDGETAAANALMKEFPGISECTVRFTKLPGNLAEPLGLKRGAVREWLVGSPARLIPRLAD
jgi:hypothetical protein